MVGLKAMDKKTSKLMTMNGALHLRADVDRLYVNQKEKRRDWMSVENVVRVKERSLSNYLKRPDVNSDRVLNVFVKKIETGTNY